MIHDDKSFDEHDWYRVLREKVAEQLEDRKSGHKPMVFIDPMQRLNAFLLHAEGLADTVVSLFAGPEDWFLTFQPAIPHEVTSYETEPPVKTRPCNNDSDMRTLAEAIAIFAKKDFLKWQATALLESQKAAAWRAESTAFLASLQKEAWCPLVAVNDDGSIKATVGGVTAKAAPGKLTITFFGNQTDFLDVIRGALRDAHRRREERRAERDAQREGQAAEGEGASQEEMGFE